MDGFDRLPDCLILLIFNSVSDIKTLIRCRSVSKRFNYLVPQTETLLLTVDRVISPESDTEPVLFTLLKSLFKSIHELFKPDEEGEKLKLTVTQNSPAQILSRFDRILELQIELPAGDLRLEKGVVIKWRAEFGRSLKSCVILGYRLASDSDDVNVGTDLAGGLKSRVVWTISALIAASARHYLLRDVVRQHTEMQRLVLKDKEEEGRVVMERDELRECRDDMAARGRDEWEWEATRTVVPSVRMRMRHEPRMRLSDGSWIEGATLVVVRPCGGGADVEDAELALGAFGGGVYEEAVQLLLQSKSYMLEMNSF
ncbi:F-box protein AUF2-like [Mercurialis annua]|uniref:F-box protein AUF2-like n=1 Tax=Mercurialis annua TaxID=3986 RepID=UPI00215F4482|nr:F-box protein AUF2-like [Mercurialis annua]